jgi:hypothetical protein
MAVVLANQILRCFYAPCKMSLAILVERLDPINHKTPSKKTGLEISICPVHTQKHSNRVRVGRITNVLKHKTSSSRGDFYSMNKSRIAHAIPPQPDFRQIKLKLDIFLFATVHNFSFATKHLWGRGPGVG